MIYTVVHDAYDIEIFGSKKKMCAELASRSLSLAEPDFYEDDDPPMATAKDIEKAMKTEHEVRLYNVDRWHSSDGWTYKIAKHDRIIR